MHAFIYSDGYSVRVRLENGGTAGFPFLSAFAPDSKAWTYAENWAREQGATTIEVRRDNVQ